MRSRSPLGLRALEDRTVPAAVGALDPSFSTDGLVTTTFNGGDVAAAVALQPDGKIVVVGLTSVGDDVAVARYNPDGTLDDTFSGDGKATFDLAVGGVTTPQVTGVALQDDGKIVVCGFGDVAGDDDFFVVRLNADGSTDTDFSTDGFARRNFNGGGTNDDQAFGVAILGTGATRKIIVVGTTDQDNNGSNFDFGIASFTDAGGVDGTFNAGGTPGRIAVTFGAADGARAVAIDSSNRIVVAGTRLSGGVGNFAVLRLTAAGTLDPGFNGGTATVNFGADDRATSVAVRPDGRVVVAGFTDAGAADFAVAQFTTTGGPDTAGFNPTGAGALGSAPGRFTFNFGAGGIVEHANAVALQPDGKIVLAGFSDINVGAGNGRDFAVARVTADGALDTSFDTDGLATVNFGGTDVGNGVALATNDKIVVAGQTSANLDFAVARLVGSVGLPHSLAVGGPNGSVAPFIPTGTGFTAGTAVTPVPGFTGTVRVVSADVNGDGFADTVAVTGAGGETRMAILSGVDGSVLLAPTVVYAGENFTFGGYVAAGDIDGDGRSEWVITPELRGGPRVQIFRLSAAGALVQVANFFGIGDPSFRDGCRAALGDVNGDGILDVFVTAAFNGGPRTALFDGRDTLTATAANRDPNKLINDFFAAPDGTDAGRGGRSIAAGDVNGDGIADLIVTGDNLLASGSQIVVYSGASLAAGQVPGAGAVVLANFTVGGFDPATLASVGMTDADGDGRGDLAVGSGPGRPARVKVYAGTLIVPGAEPAAFADLTPFDGATLADGVFVG